jgi:alpha-tubulin suppressor-like RCC1 family protein
MLVSGHESACGLAPDGLAFCWGALPDSTPGGNRIVELPISMSNGLRFASLSASRGVDPYRSAGHVCGVTGDGAAYCWGFNNTHQLGVPDTRVHPTPVALPANLRFQAVSAGGNHTCAMSVDRRVYCWGAGDLGQLGVPLDVSSRPERVTGQRP